MNDKSMFRKLKRKPKWKLRQERDELQLQQDQLRKETEVLRAEVDRLNHDIRAAYKANDETTITVIDAQIDQIEGKISRNDGRYERNAKVLEIYARIMKDDGERGVRIVDSIFGAIGVIGGLGLGWIGLNRAYKSDEEGTLVDKKTLSWVEKLPILRNIGIGKK